MGRHLQGQCENIVEWSVDVRTKHRAKSIDNERQAVQSPNLKRLHMRKNAICTATVLTGCPQSKKYFDLKTYRLMCFNIYWLKSFLRIRGAIQSLLCLKSYSHFTLNKYTLKRSHIPKNINLENQDHEKYASKVNKPPWCVIPYYLNFWRIAILWKGKQYSDTHSQMLPRSHTADVPIQWP